MQLSDTETFRLCERPRRMPLEMIRSSKDLVRETRAAWGLTKRDFGLALGLTGEHAGQVEFGKKNFGDQQIASGVVHPDATVRQFWMDYQMLRFREQQAAIIETCKASGPSLSIAN